MELLVDEEITITTEEDIELDRLELDSELETDEDEREEDELTDELDSDELVDEETDVAIATLELDVLTDDWFCSSLPPPPQAPKLNALTINKKLTTLVFMSHSAPEK